VKLRRGVVVRTGVAGRLQALMRLPVATRAASGYALTPLALLTTGLVAWGGTPPAPFWVALGVTSAISFVSWRMLARQLAAPIRDMSGFATRLAAGDLTADLQIARHDDLGDVLQAMNQLKANLAAIVYDVRAQITGMLDNAREISSGNVDLARRTELQAASLEETAATMEQLTTTVQANADASVRALDLARDAKAAAAVGGKIAGQVEQTMAGITAASRRIADITGVIDGIAFQTNILALNAAVEAARAGEQGRGFAVVATEVRNLAQRSAAAAKEIKVLIGDSVEKVEAGSRQVDDAGATMNEIVTSVQHVADIMSEISAASQEQSSGIEQVNLAITHMDEVTQQNAALVEQAAAAAQSMQDQAANLSMVVSVFKVDAGAAPRAQPPKRAAPASALPASTARPAAPRLAAKAALPRAAKPAPGNDDWEEF